ncbi:Uncharacterised protein [Mycobacteroides abscessus subsp. abscessus]|nr:Uncharacterised protein [Mycobacteroides abscessus subsp. abscessus]
MSFHCTESEPSISPLVDSISPGKETASETSAFELSPSAVKSARPSNTTTSPLRRRVRSNPAAFLFMPAS